MRANQRFQQLPVIVLTTRDDEPSRAAALAAGATVYLTKPFKPQALLAEARKLLPSAIENQP